MIRNVKRLIDSKQIAYHTAYPDLTVRCPVCRAHAVRYDVRHSRIPGERKFPQGLAGSGVVLHA